VPLGIPRHRVIETRAQIDSGRTVSTRWPLGRHRRRSGASTRQCCTRRDCHDRRWGPGRANPAVARRCCILSACADRRTSQDGMSFRLQRGGASGKKTYGHHYKSPPNTQRHCKDFDSSCCKTNPILCYSSDRRAEQTQGSRKGGERRPAVTSSSSSWWWESGAEGGYGRREACGRHIRFLFLCCRYGIRPSALSLVPDSPEWRPFDLGFWILLH
jgi:hypothetical protein